MAAKRVVLRSSNLRWTMSNCLDTYLRDSSLSLMEKSFFFLTSSSRPRTFSSRLHSCCMLSLYSSSFMASSRGMGFKSNSLCVPSMSFMQALHMNSRMPIE